MKYCGISFRSVTPAQRAEQMLHRAGIRCTLGRTPSWAGENGCGYSLKFPCTVREDVVKLLEKNVIPYKKVFAYEENSQ